ncbi:MAG: hypothetical protein IPM56_01195 [Ignavibacteriales bacterium]|nr:MAG: hypothetical protein IPM56_01195 [Ignavibacteriales bacterium]
MIKQFGTLVIFTALIFCGYNQNTYSQDTNFRFEELSGSEGLSSNFINSIVQDKQGFLWIGTEDGLNKYDGYSFKVYRNEKGNINSLSNNFIWCLAIDSTGDLWIGTDGGGLNKFNPETETFTRYTNDLDNSSSLSSNIVQNIFVDKKNNIWVSTWGGGLNLMEKNNSGFIHFRFDEKNKNTIGSDKIFSVFEDSKNRIWICTEGGGLNLFNPVSKTFKRYLADKDKNSISFNNVSSIVELNNGSLLAATTGGGLNQFFPEKNEFKIVDTEGFINIWKIFKDSNGLIWMSSSVGEGLAILNMTDNNIRKFSADKSSSGKITSNDIRDIYEDKSGMLWLAASGGGLNKVDIKPKKFFNFNLNNSSLNDYFIFSLEEDQAGKIWMGTYKSGAITYDPANKNFKHYPTSKQKNGSLNGEIVRYIYNDKKNNLWLGTYYGELNQYDAKTNRFTYYNLDSGKKNPSANLVRIIFEDSKGLIWFGASGGGGLTSYNPLLKEYKHYSSQTEPELSGDDITSIVEDNSGNLWIGTYSFGLNKFDRTANTITSYFRKEDDQFSLPDNIITDMLDDSKGNLWIGTYTGGLCKYIPQKNNFEVISEENGLSSNSVFGILEDDKNNLWLSTAKGISKINAATGEIKNYDALFGIQTSGFNPSSRLKTKSGHMYFGGIDGVTFFHPDSLESNNFIPPVFITSFKLFNEEYPLQKNISFTDTITLSYNENIFSFEFSSMDFTSPDKNMYSYMLEGFDEDWVNPGSRRFVNYTHLDAGEYTFKVKATNSYGNWNKNFAQVLVIINPPFWLTWWFKGIMVITIAGLLLSIYKRRTRQLKDEKEAQIDFSKRLISSQEEERKRIASELHDSLGQNLLVIKNLALLGLKEGFEKSRLEEISGTADTTIDEARRISYNLHPHQLDRLGLTKALEAMITNIESSSSILFEREIDNIDSLFSKEKEINIFRIIQECLNNIIKHSDASAAKVGILKKIQFIEIEVSDNGKGINTISLETSHGFGLKNINNRVALLNGKLEITSNEIFNTQINIRIPYQNAG